MQQPERLKLKIAAYLMMIKDGKILLARRFNTGWQDGNYSLPAGHLEENETILQTLMRETEEEINVKINEEGTKLVHIMHRPSHIDFFFVTDIWEGKPEIMEPNKCDDLQWFPLKNLPKNIVPSVLSTILHHEKNIFFSEFMREG